MVVVEIPARHKRQQVDVVSMAQVIRYVRVCVCVCVCVLMNVKTNVHVQMEQPMYFVRVFMHTLIPPMFNI